MTSLTDTARPTDIVAVSDADRTARLTDAGRTWGDRIAADRTSAHLTYRVRGASEGAVATRISAGRHTILVDEPAALAGDDVAASPVEYALAALISCQVVVYRLYAQALGLTIDDLQVTAEGDLDAARLFGADETVRAGFGAVRLRVEIAGPASAEEYERLRDVVDAHCPVLDLFQNPTPVTTTVVVR